MSASNPKKGFAIEGQNRSLTFGSSLEAMGLHGHVRIQMIQRAICFFAVRPTTLVHPLDFFISTAGSLMLLRAWDRDKGVHL